MISVICVICCLFSNPLIFLDVYLMPHMPFVARPALIYRHSLCFELRVLIEKFPRIILSLVSLLSLPRMLLASIVLRVWLKRRHFVEVFMSFVTHVLYLCCFGCVVRRELVAPSPV